MNTRKRLALGAGTITAIGAAATLIAGTTFGLFTSTVTSGNNTVTAGTVVVSADGSSATVTCATTNLVPGDSSTGFGSGSALKAQCKYSVHYTGSAPAALAVDVSTADTSPATSQPTYPSGIAPTAKTGLYDASAAGLQWLVKDGTHTYINGTSYKDQLVAAQPLAQNNGVTALLVDSNATVNPTDIVFTVDYSLPLSSGNEYQNAGSKIVLTFHAVQNGNNTVPLGCAAPNQCSTQAGFSWS